MIKCSKLDEVYILLEADINSPQLEQEIKQLEYLSSRFEWFARNYQHSYKFKSGQWDGTVKYLRKVKYGVYIFPIGLFNELIIMCDVNNIDLDIKFSVNDLYPNLTVDWELLKKQLNLPCHFEQRQYQIEYVNDIFKWGRCCIVSPTGSGKSAILYMTVINLLKNVFKNNEKIILIVPTVDLVTQMYEEFKSNGFTDIDEFCQLIMAGKEKIITKQLVISTWQSLQHLPESFFEQFSCLIVDECHGVSASAEKLSYISHCCKNAYFRIGTTGTIPDNILDITNMVASLGPIKKKTSTAQLIKSDYLSPLCIKSIILQWKTTDKLNINNFQEEYTTIIECEERAQLIISLCKRLLEETTGTILVLGRRVDYLHYLSETLNEQTNEDVFLVTGKHTSKKKRHDIYNSVKKTGGIFFATEKIAGTGINIENIDKIVLATPLKSKITVLQAIGRGCRLCEGKQYLEVYDFIDKIPLVGGKINSCYKWIDKKNAIYESEQFLNRTYILNLYIKNNNL